MNSDPVHDVVVIGGGPAGSTSALVAARLGLRVLLLERASHPRFHIGESFLPRNFALIKQLGLLERLNAIPHTQKLGAEFGFGHGRDGTSLFRFADVLGPGETEAFNIERAPFDAMLLHAAREAGAQVRENVQVRRILKLEEGDVRLDTDRGEVRARILLDASGQATVVGRHLKTRRVLPHLKKVAYFGHFHNVKRRAGDEEGYPTIVMCEEGWFWIIPLDSVKTSIGLVMHADVAKRINAPADQILRWAIPRCPLMMERAGAAIFPERNYITADFSYRCAPFAGPGYFLVGDAATFVDPIFSTGVCLGMMGAVQAANAAHAILRQGAHAARRRRQYCRYVDGSTAVFFKLVAQYYDHAFRELFLHGIGPMDVHRAIIGVLAGHVFPKPAWPLRWRLRLFDLILVWHRRKPLVRPRDTFALLESPTAALGAERAAEIGTPFAETTLHAAASV